MDMNYQKGIDSILPTTNIVFLDIETDGLNPSLIHCVVTKRPNEDHLVHTSRESLINELGRSGKVCGHNLIGFDNPVLSRLWDIHISDDRVVDTLVISRLFHPDVSGGHSLDAWGTRLGFKKGSHDDWSQLSDEMIEYCKRDVDVTERLYEALKQQLTLFSFSALSISLEHSVAAICKEQEDNGFYFNKKLADETLTGVNTRMEQIEELLQEIFPPIVEERISEKTGKRLKDKVTVFNVSSRQQIAQRLEEKGAYWCRLTPTGLPVVDERSLKDNSYIKEAVVILEYLTLQKRQGMLKSWLENVGEDDRIHGRVRHIGAVTGRMSHSSPNLAQIPSESDYRKCFTVPEGKVLVGADASGLELRMLAHYMDSEKYTKELLEGDIHSLNQELAGLPTRAAAKTFIYAFLYGAGDAKLGNIVGDNAKRGKQMRETFLSRVGSLKRLKELVTMEASTGYLYGLDGRRLRVRSQHAALNTLLQSAGAIVMKQAIVILYDLLENVDFKLVAQVHDEWQIECNPEDADFIGKSCVNAMVFAGEQFKLNCPLAGEYKIGNNWSETH